MLVYIIRDNRPGHYRQCEGVAKAISHFAKAEVRNVFPNFHWYSRRLLPGLIHRARRIPPELALRLLYDFEIETLDPPDLVIASGRRNIIPALLFKTLYGARFVYAGLHDGGWLSEMDLIVTPLPRDGYEPKHVYAPVLNPISRADYGPPRPIRELRDLHGARLALLVGGECSSHRYKPHDWKRLGAFVSTTRRDYGVEWHATTSRRTPRAAVEVLRALDKAGEFKTYIEYDPAFERSANEILGMDATLVTEDSMTMISEALSAGRPCIALKPARVWPSRQDEAVTAMASLGATAVMPFEQLTVNRLVRCLSELEPVPFDPVETLRRNLAASPAILQALGIPRQDPVSA